MPNNFSMLDEYIGFIKVVKTQCTSKRRHEFRTFKNAIEKCLSNDGCHGVLDYNCDGKGRYGNGKFRHCTSNDGVYDKDDCVYKKKGILH